ncbi:Uncharacterised protein [uncultured archaeon]|nr:Uncharacterised protein [uncultured archaeon]
MEEKMTENNPIELRGHHLSLFADYYFRNKCRTDSADSKVIQAKGKYKLTDLLTNEPIFSDSQQNEGNYESDFISRKYSPAIRKHMSELWQKLIDEPETKVKLVEGFDNICMFAGGKKCPRYEESSCGPEGYADDILTIAELQLETGKTYSSKEIISRIVDYRKQTGFISPKEKFLKLLLEFNFEDSSSEEDISDEEIDRIMNGEKQ